MQFIINNIKTDIIIPHQDFDIDGTNLYKELRNMLRVKDPNAYWSNRKGWDGYKYYLHGKGNRFYMATGFLPMTLSFLEELQVDRGINIKVTIIDERTSIPEFDVAQLAEEQLVLNDKVLYDHQVRCVKAVVQNRLNYFGYDIPFPRGVIDAATNAGKTLVCHYLIDLLTTQNKSCLYLVHSKNLFDQTIKDFKANGFEVGRVNSNYKELGKRVTVAMNKSLANMISKNPTTVTKQLSEIDMLVIDEGHLAGATDYASLLQKVNIPIRLAVSGTPLENENVMKNITIVGLTGRVLQKVTNKELTDLNVSAKPSIKFLLNATQIETPIFNYADEVDRLIHNSANRLKLIGDELEQRDGEQIVISFEIIAHGMFMFNYLTKRFPYMDIAITHGKDSGRTYKIEKFSEGKINILLVSRILQEGINIPNINTLIFSQGMKSTVKVKQFFGRVLRKENKDLNVEEKVTVIDFYDTDHKFNDYGVSKHSRARIRLYQSEGYEVELNYPNRRNKPI